VDEAGDAGITGKPGQTPYFVVAVVNFEENDQTGNPESPKPKRELVLPLG